MDNQNKDAVYVKYLKKCADFSKSTLSSVEKTYTDAANAKNCIAGIGASVFFLIQHLSFFFCFLSSFLLTGTHLVFGTYPMGVAFVSATGKHMLWAYAGACVGALTSSSHPAIDVAIYTMVVCLRRLTAIIAAPERKLTDFEDSMKLKLISSLIAATTLGAYNSIVSDFSPSSLAALILYIAIVPSLTFLYTCTVSEQRSDATMLYSEASKGALIVSLIMSLRTVSFSSIDLSAAAAMTASVYITRKRGLLKGCLIGLFLGLSGLPVLTPIYSLSAIVSGILFSSSPYLAVASATLAAVSWTVYAGGYTVASSVAPSVILGGIIAEIGIYGGFFASENKNSDASLPQSAVLRAEMIRNYDTDKLLSSEAQAFTELSDMLYRLSDKLRKPTYGETREAVFRARENICRLCEASDVCGKLNENELSDVFDNISNRLDEIGTLTYDNIPKFLLKSCPHSSELFQAVNEAYASLIKNIIDTDKTEAMAIDYRAIASVLGDIIERRKTEFSIDRELSRLLSERLRKEKIAARQVAVYGGSRRTVFISSIKLSGLHIGEDDLRKIASETCGNEFSSPKFELNGNEVSATLYASEAFSVIYASKSLTEEESRACGDSSLCFSSENGHFVALISDGMGSGHEAAVTSGMCVLFIEKMLSAGNSAAVTLKMLNSMLRAKRSECSSTVDLCDFDLISGNLEFYKSGASPTIIVRGNDIFKIEARTLPVGIIRSLDSQKTGLKAEIGDVIIMMSDGIAESDEDSAWLYSLVSEVRERKCSDIADLILGEAEKRYKKRDDATVCVIRIAPPSKKDFNV